jgi:IrrE N-terminal-like domain
MPPFSDSARRDVKDPMTAAELAAGRREHVARYARGALLAADALGVVPTPLEEVGAALRLATPQQLFDLGEVPPDLARRLRRLFGKVKGAFAVRERTIYLDVEQPSSQRRFVYGHEIGHDALPWHTEAYYGEDCRTLDPDTRDELEAEANAFSADLLFNMDAFTDRAHSSRPGLASALELADTFATSRHASIRRYVEDSPRSCALLILGRYVEHHEGRPALAVLRTLESAAFRDRYGPINACFPSKLPITQRDMTMDAYRALRGTGPTPIVVGETTVESSRGQIKLDYEVYSNTYFCFVLLIPHRRITSRNSARVLWN